MIGLNPDQVAAGLVLLAIVIGFFIHERERDKA